MPEKPKHGDDRMQCKELFALLSQYVDAELNPKSCAEIEKHLQGCDPCVAFLNTLRKTAELCRQYQPAELPRPLQEQVRRDLRAAYDAARRRRSAKR